MSNWRDPDESEDYTLPSRDDSLNDSHKTMFGHYTSLVMLFVAVLIGIILGSLGNQLFSGNQGERSEPQILTSLEEREVRTEQELEANKKELAALEEILLTKIETSKLRDLLKKSLEEKDWQAADDLTRFIFYSLADNKKEFIPYGRIDEPDKCEVIKEIDQDWKDASEDLYGFSVQLSINKEIRQNLQKNPTSEEKIKEKFGTRVGWFKDKWLSIDDLDLAASIMGALPTRTPSGFGLKLDQGMMFKAAEVCLNQTSE